MITRGITFCTVGLIVVFSLRAQAPEPAKLPGEPHHHLKIDNEYVRAYYVEVPPHEETQLHQHDHDYIYVSLGPADVINAVLNKPEVHVVLKDGETHFTRGGFAHVARNLSDAPFRNVTIELLKPQDNLQNLCERVVEGELGECHPIENRSIFGKQYFRSAETSVFFATLKPRAEFTSLPSLDSLLVAVGPNELELAFPNPHLEPRPGHQPTTRLEPGDSYWVSANRIETITNLRKEPSSYLQILFNARGRSKK